MSNPIVIAVVAGIVLLVLFAVIDRVLTPYWAKRNIRRLLADKTKLDRRALENPKYGRLVAGSASLILLTANQVSIEIPWIEVEEVHAYKRDLFSTDLICLAFKKSGRDEYLEIHEEMAGYHDLLDNLPQHLPKFSLDWFFTVAFPAFETNHQVIWKRSNTPDE